MSSSSPSNADIRVYVNSTGVTVPAGATALDAVRSQDPSAAAAVVAGDRVITDSRGLPIAADTPAYGGAIYRLASARALRDAVQEEQEL
jgi:hypothetical protein